jgi:hypothetical protein
VVHIKPACAKLSCSFAISAHAAQYIGCGAKDDGPGYGGLWGGGIEMRRGVQEYE